VIDQPRFEVSLESRGVHRSIFPATPAGVRAVATGAEILVKASVAETSKAPVAETGEDHPVVMDLENLQRLRFPETFRGAPDSGEHFRYSPSSQNGVDRGCEVSNI
jgi:hypothetical protein